MSNEILNHTLEFWGDLEFAYINKLGDLNKVRAKKKLPLITNRLDFIKALTGYIEKENRVRLNYVKSRLSEEVGGYDSSELQKYSDLMEVFQGVTSLLCEQEVLEIVSFKGFIEEIRGNAIRDNANQKALDPTFFDGLQPIKTRTESTFSVNTLSTSELYSLTGQLGNTHMSVDGQVKSFLASDSMEDSLFIIANKQVDILMNRAESGNPFAKKLVDCIRGLYTANKFKFQTLFLDSNYFKLSEKENSAEITFGQEKIKMKLNAGSKVEVLGGKTKMYIGKIDTKIGCINAVLMS